jgi:hypothetical protein
MTARPRSVLVVAIWVVPGLCLWAIGSWVRARAVVADDADIGDGLVLLVTPPLVGVLAALAGTARGARVGWRHYLGSALVVFGALALGSSLWAARPGGAAPGLLGPTLACAGYLLGAAAIAFGTRRGSAIRPLAPDQARTRIERADDRP